MNRISLLALTIFALCALPNMVFADTITFPTYIVGNSSGTTVYHKIGGSSVYGFVVTVLDGNGNPRTNYRTWIDFAAGTGLVTLYPSQPSGVFVSCVSKYVEVYTNSSGKAVYSVKFGGTADTGDHAVVLHVGDTTTFNLRAISTDYDRDGDTDLADLAVFSADFDDPGYQWRSDFDGNTNSKLGDLSIFGESYGSSCGCSLCY